MSSYPAQETRAGENSSDCVKKRLVAADAEDFDLREPQPPRTTMDDTGDHHFQARRKSRNASLSSEVIWNFEAPILAICSPHVYLNV